MDQLHPDKNGAFYAPYASGKYSIRLDLFALSTDFGNGGQDQRLFQWDRNFSHYHQVKMAVRQESLAKYVQSHDLSKRVEQDAALYIMKTLAKDYPLIFQFREHLLHSDLTEETISLDGRIHQPRGLDPINPAYSSLLDALTCQIQEDIAILVKDKESDRLAYIHLCYPSYWSAQEKIGKSFLFAHSPVPRFEEKNPRAQQMVAALLTKGPYVRFAWGITTNARLNHHPYAPEGILQNEWGEQPFSPEKPVYVRVERQTLSPLPDVNAFLFTIRPYLYPVHLLSDTLKKGLVCAIQSMDPLERGYKRLEKPEALIAWIEATMKR